MLRIIAISLPVVFTIFTDAFPYADNYPYKVRGGLYSVHSGGGKDENGFVQNNVGEHENKINSANDAVRYHNLDNHANGHNIHQTKKGGNVEKLKHTAGENYEVDKNHKKKHIKSGFSNSYHKDENGSKSSFFEEDSDNGGKTVYDKTFNDRNNYNDRDYTEGYRNNHNRNHYDDRYGGHDNRNAHEGHLNYAHDEGNQHGSRDGFHKQHNDRYEHYDQPSRYNYHSSVYPSRYYQNEYNRQPSYNSHSSQITVFEDPRFTPVDLDNDYYRRRTDFDDDHRRLNFRPSPLTHHY